MTTRTDRLSTPIVRAAVVIALGLAVLACGGAGTSAVPSVGPSPSIPATAASLMPLPTPSPVATHSNAPVGSGDPYAQALVAALASEPLITHLEQTATATQTGGSATSVTATLSGDVSGDDVALHLTTTVAGQTSEQDIVVVGDSAYVREGGGAWQKAPRLIVAASMDNLVKAMRLTTDPADLRYVGLETVEGRLLHHLTSSRPIPYTPANGGTGQYDVFDVWIEEDGTPVVARTAFSATDAAGNKANGTTEFRYSKFGGPIQIVAPSVAPTASP